MKGLRLEVSRFQSKCPGHRAGLSFFGRPILAVCGELFGVFARSAAAVGLAAGCQLAEIGAPAFCSYGAAPASKDCGCGQLGLFEEIVSKGQSGLEQFAASRGTIFRERGSGKD